MILAIDAATTSASVALYKEGNVLADFTINNGYTHSENLLPLIDGALKFAGEKKNDVTDVIVSNGPGSFTGIRIALATAKAFCHASGANLYTLSTLDALVYHGKHTHAALICPILNARRHQVYTKVKHAQGDVLLKNTALPMAELLNYLDEKLDAEEKVLFVGDGVLEFKDTLSKRLGKRAILGTLDRVNSSALGLIDAHLEGITEPSSYVDVSVNYLRKPQAERELEARLKND